MSDFPSFRDISALETKVEVILKDLDARKYALELQAIEYERRLEDLNHAHEIQTRRNAEYISRETHETKMDEINRRLMILDQWRWISIGAGATLGSVMGFLTQFILSKIK